MYRAAQEAGTPHRGYIDRKKENVIFTLLEETKHHFHPFVCVKISSCQYTHGVARRLLGPHDTLSCVLIIYTLLYLGDPLSDWNQICYRVARQPAESTYQI